MEMTLRLLLMLSQKLTSARREAALKEALPLILAATGSAFGVVYLERGGALALAVQSGMPAKLRSLVERLDPDLAVWSLPQRAASSRALAVDLDLPARAERRLAFALKAAAWEKAAACPLMTRGALHGVLLIASPRAQEIDPVALVALEVAGNTLALHLGSPGRSRSRQERQEIADAETARMAIVAA